MDHFPAFLPLAGRRVVIVGSGEAADAKARLFDGSPAVLVRLEVPDPAVLAAADLVFIALPDGPALEAALAQALENQAQHSLALLALYRLRDARPELFS